MTLQPYCNNLEFHLLLLTPVRRQEYHIRTKGAAAPYSILCSQSTTLHSSAASAPCSILPQSVHRAQTFCSQSIILHSSAASAPCSTLPQSVHPTPFFRSQPAHNSLLSSSPREVIKSSTRTIIDAGPDETAVDDTGNWARRFVPRLNAGPKTQTRPPNSILRVWSSH
jgi:hypothetical protein